jgi:hypothetical protein
VPTYKVVFLGLIVAGSEEEARLIAGLQKKFALSPEKAERLLQRVPIVVKKGIGKEEMERYVKAFEGIGGKLKVEEEATAGALEFPREPEPASGPGAPRKPEPPPKREPPPEPQPPASEPEPPPLFKSLSEKKPHAGRMVTCPQCGFEQPETDECVKCGVIISKFVRYQEMAKAYEGQVHEISSEENPPPSWEGGEGFIGSFFTTTKEVLFSPTQFFRKVGDGRGYWAPLIYGVICGVIGGGATVFWQWLFASKFIPAHYLSAIPYFSIFLILFVIAFPFMIGFSIFVGSAITHLCLMIVGGNKKGFEPTFRALAYAYGGNLFGIIPFIGSTIGGIYSLVLIIFGVKEVHGISTGRAVLAVLLPPIAVVVLAILLSVLGYFLFGFGLFRSLSGVRI